MLLESAINMAMGKNLWKLFQDSRSGLKCQKISDEAENRSVRKWLSPSTKMSEKDFQKVQKCQQIFWLVHSRKNSDAQISMSFSDLLNWEFLSVISVYWNPEIFVTSLDPFSDILVLGSVFGCFYPLETKIKIFLKIWHFYITNSTRKFINGWLINCDSRCS